MWNGEGSWAKTNGRVPRWKTINVYSDSETCILLNTKCAPFVRWDMNRRVVSSAVAALFAGVSTSETKPQSRAQFISMWRGREQKERLVDIGRMNYWIIAIREDPNNAPFAHFSAHDETKKCVEMKTKFLRCSAFKLWDSIPRLREEGKQSSAIAWQWEKGLRKGSRRVFSSNTHKQRRLGKWLCEKRDKRFAWRARESCWEFYWLFPAISYVWWSAVTPRG